MDFSIVTKTKIKKQKSKNKKNNNRMIILVYYEILRYFIIYMVFSGLSKLMQSQSFRNIFSVPNHPSTNEPEIHYYYSYNKPQFECINPQQRIATEGKRNVNHMQQNQPNQSYPKKKNRHPIKKRASRGFHNQP